MENLPVKTKKDAVVLADIYNESTIIEFAAREQLQSILNAAPFEKWVKDHPFVKGHRYLPIDKVEYLLKKLFKRYRIEVLKTASIFNAIEVTVRVHYIDPITKEWDFQDGVGAQELQTTKDSGVLKPDFSNVNKGAVTMALPIAKTLAVKDACDHIGVIFGANLNRRDTLSYEVDTRVMDKMAELQEKQLNEKNK